MQEQDIVIEDLEPVVASLTENIDYMNRLLMISKSFDLTQREISFGGRRACMYFVDGFCKDELIQKLLQNYGSIKPEQMPDSMEELSAEFTPYVEVEVVRTYEEAKFNMLCGKFLLFVDGYTGVLVIDSRTYPARGVSEPDKDKVLRGSKDGFVETIVQNTALIRRRIRSADLRMEIMNAGESSKTDIVICYMQSRVNHKLLALVRERISRIQVDALTMNTESLAECLYQRKWYNPYPKFKYSERPDTTAAHVLDGSIAILVDNSPQAMILPTTFFEVLDEPDDYYFPPITGTYLRFTRMLTTLFTYLTTPTFLLFVNHIDWVPKNFAFVLLKEDPNIPLIWQFLILEFAIDGLKLAAINTPNMLSTPLSVMAALVLGEFSVKSGWFSAEVMLYMAFVAIANYTQANYELGYALKFMRMINLILTQLFGLPGYIAALALAIAGLVFNKTISGDSYLYPLIPFDWEKLKYCLFRRRLPGARRR